MFEDEKYESQIDECKKRINQLEKKIGDCQECLNDNMKLKSALYSNGEELVEIIFEILQELFGVDLTDFVDKKKEDFLFKFNDTYFIGEIKGVNHNVKSQNVSQIDVHYQNFLEENEEIKEENVKALLVINHQKGKPIFERETVKDTQINLAKRNGCLIIETYTLLKILEKYRSGIMTRDEVYSVFKVETGIVYV